MHIQWNEQAEFILGKIFGPNIQVEKLKEQIDKQLMGIERTGKSFASDKTVSSRPKGQRQTSMKINGKNLIVEYVKNGDVMSVQMVEIE